MMPPLLPDVAQLVFAYLRAAPAVVALVGARVYTTFPKQVGGEPFVLVQRVGGEPVLSRPLIVDAALVQLDAYGGRQQAAHELVATCRAALSELVGEQPNGSGNVAGVVVGALRYVPDEAFQPPRPRYVSDLEITVKPSATILAGAPAKNPSATILAGTA